MSVTLADLRPGQAGTVAGYVDEDGTQHLMQMGLVEGTRVEVLRYAPAGDPLEIRLLGYALSLRAREARLVQVADVGPA